MYVLPRDAPFHRGTALFLKLAAMMKLLTFACLTVLAASDACKPSAGGCCDFSGSWTNTKPPTNGPSHDVTFVRRLFNQTGCAIACVGCAGCNGTMATASNDTLAVNCTGF